MRQLQNNKKQLISELEETRQRLAKLEASEAERRRAEEKQQAIVKTALDGFWLTNLEGKLLEVNDSYCKMIGYTREELLKMSIPDIEAVESPEEVVQHIKRITEQGYNRFESQHKRKDGKIIDVEVSVNYLDVGEGQFFVFARDITERKQAEVALRESEEFSSSLLKNSPNQILVINPDTTVRYVNPAFEKQTGFTSAEIIGSEAPYPWWPDESKKAISASLKETMARGGRKRERIFQKKNGERFWVAINSAPVMHRGTLKYFLINWVDITERKRAEEALRESEEKFSKAFHDSPDMVTICTLEEGKFIDVNDSFTRFTGYSREEVINSKSTDINFWVNAEDRNKMVETLKEQGRLHNREHDFLMKSGEIRSGLFSSELLNIGSEPCIITVSTDITELKQAIEKAREADALRELDKLRTEILASITG